VIDPKNNIDVTAGHPPRLDVGAALGLQYQLQKKVSLEARYLYGFNTLYSVDAVGERYTDQKGANRVFQLGARYRLH
jgi:long-subunit fatty acid transport protein